VERWIEKARTLIEALPYIRAFFGKTIVVKYGGKAMVEEELKEQFSEDIALMKYVGMKPVVVHGGGPQINQMLKRLGREPKFVRGVRVTDRETMEVVEMVLGGTINKEIVARINRHGGKAVGLSGKDGRLITARRLRGKPSGSRNEPLDLGQVGEVEAIDPQILNSLDQDRFIPVIAPIGVDKDGKTYNINADLVAGSIAAALKAEKIIILTDVKGILDQRKKLIPTVSKKEVMRLIKSGVISEGMLPKVQCCLTALEGGVRKAHIINGCVPHALLLEILTDRGVGTEIVV
jgi:acetylglutamate kinase